MDLLQALESLSGGLLLLGQFGGLPVDILEETTDDGHQEDEHEVEAHSGEGVEEGVTPGQCDQGQEARREESGGETGAQTPVDGGEDRGAHGQEQIGTAGAAGEGDRGHREEGPDQGDGLGAEANPVPALGNGGRAQDVQRAHRQCDQ